MLTATQSALDRACRQDYIFLVIKDFGNLSHDGHPDPLATALPSCDYVRKVSDYLIRANQTIDVCNTSVKEIIECPPLDYLKYLGLTELDYIQSRLDIFTVFLFAALDGMLLPSNHVLTIGLADRSCSYNRVQSRIKHSHPDLFVALEELRSSLSSVEQLRHLIVHRGEKGV